MCKTCLHKLREKKNKKKKKKSIGGESVVEHSPQILACDKKATTTTSLPPPSNLKWVRTWVKWGLNEFMCEWKFQTLQRNVHGLRHAKLVACGMCIYHPNSWAGRWKWDNNVSYGPWSEVTTLISKGPHAVHGPRHVKLVACSVCVYHPNSWAGRWKWDNNVSYSPWSEVTTLISKGPHAVHGKVQKSGHCSLLPGNQKTRDRSAA